MFTCFAEGSKDSDSEGTDRQLPLPGPDIKAMEKNLKPALKASLRKLVNDDDADGLEEALEAERSANPKPPSKKNKKKSGTNGSKEEDEFAILGRKLLHYAVALDAVDCCKLLLTSQNFPRIWVDAVDEADQRSALHVASLNHSKRCIEVLLKQGANVSLKNKQLAVPLEEALLSGKVNVDWEFATPAAQIVEKLREKDLTALRTLEQKCKDLLIPVAFKFAKNLKLVPLVALLIVARSSYVVNSVAKKVEGEEDSVGTLVDLLLGKALACSSVCSLDKVPPKCKKTYPDGTGEAWPGEINRLLRKTSFEGDGTGLESKIRRNSSDWESPFETKVRRDSSDWEENCSEIKYKKDMAEWDEITSKYGSNGYEGESSNSDSKFRRSCSGGDMDRKGAKVAEDKCAAVGEDVETDCKIARKLLECVLLFSPRLSAHPQSPALPPLLRAAQANDEVLLSLLLEAGAPINETDSDGNTALHWALRQATPVNKRSVNRKLVKRLLDAGANVLMGNKLGATPVHTAAGHGHFEALQLILEKEGGGVNVMAATKETPLHYSVKNNHLLCTALLLTHGANRNVSSLRSQKPFQLAPSPEMRALLSLDEATLREQSSESLLQTLAVVAQQQQQAAFQCAEGPSMTLAPTFAQAASQSIPKSQFQFPQAVGNYTGTQPISFSQSLSMPALAETLNHSQLAYKSSQQFHPPLSLRSQSLPSSQEARSWNSVCLSDSFSKFGLHRGAQKLRMNDLDLVDDDGKANVNLPAWKTVLCRNYGTSEGCTWGNKCHFAHSEEELRAGQQNLKTTGEKSDGGLGIKGFQLGQLTGDAGDQGVKNFKTKLCMHHEKMGTCPHGGKCKFAHGEGELRPLSAASSLTSGPRVGMRPSTASSLASTGSEEGDDSSSRKVFVGGLPHFIHSDELREFFEVEFGKVVDAVVICGNDEEGKPRSRGFGFVLFEQQKDADEAVKRHYFPFRGKKVEVKRAMARMDSPSGDEAGKLASSFSSGISSPAAPLSPALPSSLPGISLYNDGMQLPTLPAIGPPPGWSMPSLPAETPKEGVHSSHLFSQSRAPPLPQSSAAYVSDQKYSHQANSGQSPPLNNKLYSEDSETYAQISEPFTHSVVHSSQNGVQPASRITRPQVEINLNTVTKPYAESSYNSYSSSSGNSSLPSSLSNVPNGTATHNSNPNKPFSYFEQSAPQPYFNSAQSKPAQASESNGDEDDELSQLVEMLKGPSPQNQSASIAHTLPYSSQPPVSSLISQTNYDGGVHHGNPAQNGAKESASMYIRDPPNLPYNGSPSLLPSYSGLSTTQLPDGFREVPPSSTKYTEVGQASNSSGYHTSQVGNLGYNPHLPMGSKTISDNHVSNSLEVTAPRGVVASGGNPTSNVMSMLLPGFNNSQQGSHTYDYGHYGGYDEFEVSR
ncbi:unnamed protein product [Calypogeia fissa]